MTTVMEIMKENIHKHTHTCRIRENTKEIYTESKQNTMTIVVKIMKENTQTQNKEKHMEKIRT